MSNFNKTGSLLYFESTGGGQGRFILFVSRCQFKKHGEQLSIKSRHKELVWWSRDVIEKNGPYKILRMQCRGCGENLIYYDMGKNKSRILHPYDRDKECGYMSSALGFEYDNKQFTIVSTDCMTAFFTKWVFVK